MHLYDSDWERSEGGCGYWTGEATMVKLWSAAIDLQRPNQSPDREPYSLLLLWRQSKTDLGPSRRNQFTNWVWVSDSPLAIVTGQRRQPEFSATYLCFWYLSPLLWIPDPPWKKNLRLSLLLRVTISPKSGTFLSSATTTEESWFSANGNRARPFLASLYFLCIFRFQHNIEPRCSILFSTSNREPVERSHPSIFTADQAHYQNPRL